MKLYGEGVLCYPASSRVVHDFEDGPFNTDDPVLIAHAMAQGYKAEPVKAPPAPALDKAALVARAAELKLAAPSVLERWAPERLAAEIAKAKV